MRAIRHNADSNDNPTSKDEGYSTMPSNVKVDSSSVQLFLFHRFRLLVTGHFTTERKRQIDCRPVDDPFAADGQRRCSVRRRPGGRVAPPTKSLHFPARDAFRRRTGRTKKRANEETPSSAHFMDHVASSFFNNNKKDPSFSPVRPSLCTFLIQIFFLIFSI